MGDGPVGNHVMKGKRSTFERIEIISALCIPQVLLCKVGFLRDVLLLPALNSGDETVISGLACFLSEIGHAAPSLITEASPEAFVLTDALL
ncbi:Importin-13, partial [Datura stramonium]|nr:Importin-13 [Datura stramonium]